MALVKAEVKRAILSSLARSTTVEGLLKGLQNFQDRAFAANKSGQSLASSSGAGHSAMFRMLESMPPDEILGLSQELIETFGTAKASLISEGNAAPAGSQILSRMLTADNMNAVTRSQTDFTGIRFPAYSV